MLESTLLLTKLNRPPVPVKWIRRPQLTQRLNEGLDHQRPLTMVSAPAGFGKTTCVSAWVNSLDHRPSTWLSLDPSDDDPRHFFAYLIAALQEIDNSLGQEIQGVLRAGQLSPSEIISTILINDIQVLDREFLLILDNFHVIQDPFILQVFERMVVNWPRPLYLVLVTREDPALPLARLRANNQLTEIRVGDLRFGGQDMGRYLDEVLGLSLSRADVDELAVKTEGWIAGVQLAGLSIREQSDPSEFISTLSGSQRHILSYLIEQVLSQQPDEIQQFLLQTAFLDKLSSGLCDAVTGRSDSRAMLARLLNANLFLVPLDYQQEWYRYHRLFADLLRDLQMELHQDSVSVLHQRASHWYAQAGMVDEAIQHALAAEDYAQAVELLERHAMQMITRGYVKTVKGWVEALPAEWKSQSPRTHLAFAWMHMLGGDYDQIPPYLKQLESTTREFQTTCSRGDEFASLKAEWLVIQSLMRYMQGETGECMEMASRALALAPEQDSRVRSLAYYGQASVLWLREEYPQAVERYRNSIMHGRQAGNLIAEMMSTAGLAGMAVEHGQLQLAFEVATQAVERIERSGALPPISALVYAVLGDAHYQRHQLDESRRYLLRAIHLGSLGGSNTVTMMCRALLSRLLLLEGEVEAAARELEQAEALMPAEAPEYVRQELAVQQVRFYLAREERAAAELALVAHDFSFQKQYSFPDLADPHSTRKRIAFSRAMVYNYSLRVLLHRARSEDNSTSLQIGRELASRLVARGLEVGQVLVTLEALLLRAQLHRILGDDQASQADTLQALRMAQPEGYISIFVEHGRPVAEALTTLSKRKQTGTVPEVYLERILAAFRQASHKTGQKPSVELPTGTGPEALIEPLTDREREVLQWMAEGLTYKEVAARLFISVNTVRYHVKGIYGKLNVNSRLLAIETARQLGLL